jgi:hypothetical protein
LCCHPFQNRRCGDVYADSIWHRSDDIGWGNAVFGVRANGVTTRLATEISTAVAKICEIDVERVLVVIQPSSARFAVEGGRVLPEPGQEQAWLAGS